MLVTLLEITILPKEEQLANANAPMLLTLSGRTRLLKEEQLAYLLLVDYQYYTL